jgi:hypothetical protein
MSMSAIAQAAGIFAATDKASDEEVSSWPCHLWAAASSVGN